jgi:AcrR family transcriptional regulator
MGQNAHSMAPNAHSTRRAREIAHTRRDILEASARVFAEAGYHGATMQAIAGAAGFTAASLYTYFRSKDEIYEALVDDLRSAVLATFDARIPAGLTFAQRLELLVQLQLELLASRRTAIRIMFDRGPRRLHHQDGASPIFARLVEFMREGAAELRFSAEDAARLLFGIFQATFFPWLFAGAPEGNLPRDAPHRIVDVFLHGAAVPVTPPEPASSRTEPRR